MLYNCAPLTFMDVDAHDYARAMLGVYEFNDVSLAADLFEWTYRKSIDRYQAVIQSMGAPDLLSLRYRDALTEAVGSIVRDGKTLVDAVQTLNLTDEDEAEFKPLLVARLDKLETYNCARYRLTERATEAWIARGRPR